MEGETKPHPYRTGGAGGDLFICFTSRSASTSMRNPSTKSLPSPGRKDGKPSPVPALTVSRSRRLKNSDSVKRGQSPGLFASVAGGSRKKGGAFESAEPGSPKVTCIGQVRVKTGRKKKKKAVAAMRSRSRRVGGGRGETSFRLPERGEEGGECFGNRNQRWVHLPLGSICEAVKTFGSEMNCFVPCGGGRSLCSGGGEREKLCVSSGGVEGGEKRVTCGAAFARWLMSIEEGEVEDKGEELGVVMENRRRGSRREVREVELVADELERGEIVVERKEDGQEENDAPPVCVPPKNALLLMRCRSDPVRMSTLANRLWGSPVRKMEVEEEASDEGGDVKERLVEPNGNITVKGGGEEYGRAEVSTSDGENKGETIGESFTVVDGDERAKPLNVEKRVTEVVATEESKDTLLPNKVDDKDQVLRNGSAADGSSKVEEEQLVEGKACNSEEGKAEPQDVVNTEEEKENVEVQVPEVSRSQVRKCDEKKRSKKLTSVPSEKEGRRWSFSKEREGRRHSFSTEKDYISRRSSSYREGRRSSFSSEGEGRRYSFSSEMEIRRRRRSFSTEKQARRDVNLQLEASKEVAAKETAKEVEKPNEIDEGRLEVRGRGEEGEKKKELPDCLLMMMMCEPKLSMEVSKETWVCTADFYRPLRDRPHRQSNNPKPEELPTTKAEEVKKTEKEEKKSQKEEKKIEKEEKKSQKEEKKIEKEEKKTEKEEISTICSNGVPPPEPSPQPSMLPSTLPENGTKGKSEPLEQKAENVTAIAATMTSSSYGPLVLTRCKSEPMRSSAKLFPDACFWKSRHQPLSTAGVGF